MSTDALAEQIAARVAAIIADQPRPLLDAETAAQLLGVPKTWLLAEARADRVPHRRLGKYVRFDAHDLDNWSRGRARGPRSRKEAA